MNISGIGYLNLFIFLLTWFGYFTVNKVYNTASLYSKWDKIPNKTEVLSRSYFDLDHKLEKTSLNPLSYSNAKI